MSQLIKRKNYIRYFLDISLLVPSPGDDGDPAPVAVLVVRHLEDPVPPQYVHVPPEGVNASVRLRHRDLHLSLGVLEGRVPLRAKRHRNSKVLGAGLVGLHRGRVVVEGLPLAGVTVPGKFEFLNSISLPHFLVREFGNCTYT